MSVRKEYPLCAFSDGTLTIKDYTNDGKAFDYSNLETICFEGSEAQWKKVKYFNGKRDIKIDFK